MHAPFQLKNESFGFNITISSETHVFKLWGTEFLVYLQLHELGYECGGRYVSKYQIHPSHISRNFFVFWSNRNIKEIIYFLLLDIVFLLVNFHDIYWW